MAMLEVKDLEVHYGVIRAIKGISFEVNEGEVISLIGANGAGKTTTLHAVSGLLSKSAGSVTLPILLLTRWCRLEWHTFLRAEECFRSLPFLRILSLERILEVTRRN